MVEHKSNESYLLYKRSLTESSGAQNVIKLDTQIVGNDIILSDSDNINWKMVITSSRNFNLQVLAIITEVIKGVFAMHWHWHLVLFYILQILFCLAVLVDL